MATASPLIGKKIVVQEPNCITAILLDRAITKAGCMLLYVSKDSLETAEIVRHVRPDLVLVDLDQSEAEGNCSSALPAAESPACLVVITAEPGDCAQERARSLGASGYLCKPFSVESVVPTLERAMLVCRNSALRGHRRYNA